MQLNTDNLSRLDFSKSDNGLLPAIVQHAHSGVVLMQGYVNLAALTHSFSSGLVTFFSRSKQRLWTKGESSGHHLQLQCAVTDCDRDAVLLYALPAGPTCHLGCNSCFDAPDQAALVQNAPTTTTSAALNTQSSDAEFLFALDGYIAQRKNAAASQSYTASLLQGDLSRAAQKVGEEGVEVALAAMKHDNVELANEAADLLFHTMVLLHKQGLTLHDVLAVLKNRHQAR